MIPWLPEGFGCILFSAGTAKYQFLCLLHLLGRGEQHECLQNHISAQSTRPWFPAKQETFNISV